MAYFLQQKSNADGAWANVKLNLLGDLKLLDNLKSYDVSKTKRD
jgi:hypothetical protein